MDQGTSDGSGRDGCYNRRKRKSDGSTGKVGDRKSVETTKVTKTAHIFTCSLLYNSNFVNFVKELNLSSVGFVTFDKLDDFKDVMMM